MVPLTAAQAGLLLWIGRQVGPVAFTQAGDSSFVTVREEERPVDPGDIGELEALGLIREAEEGVFMITSPGRAMCRELSTPPHAAGFQSDRPAG